MRGSQYRRKIDCVASKLGDLPPNLDDEYQFEALLYRLHTSIEAIMSIVAMLVKDLGFEVGDDCSNVERLESGGGHREMCGGLFEKAEWPEKCDSS